jgi:hypothetical protein
LQCIAVPIRLQDATLIHQPSHVLLPLGASVVFKSSIKLTVPPPILQARPPPLLPFVLLPTSNPRNRSFPSHIFFSNSDAYAACARCFCQGFPSPGP